MWPETKFIFIIYAKSIVKIVTAVLDNDNLASPDDDEFLSFQSVLKTFVLVVNRLRLLFLQVSTFRITDDDDYKSKKIM